MGGCEVGRSAGTYSSEGWARKGLPRGIPSGADVRARVVAGLLSW
jgi:hypothetical protein